MTVSCSIEMIYDPTEYIISRYLLTILLVKVETNIHLMYLPSSQGLMEI
jgi:hypothetical protein